MNRLREKEFELGVRFLPSKSETLFSRSAHFSSSNLNWSVELLRLFSSSVEGIFFSWISVSFSEFWRRCSFVIEIRTRLTNIVFCFRCFLTSISCSEARDSANWDFPRCCWYGISEREDAFVKTLFPGIFEGKTPVLTDKRPPIKILR